MNNTFFDFKLFKLPKASTEPSLLQGQARRGLLIIFEAPEEEASKQIDFLAKILQAIKLDLNQDTLFINRNQGESFQMVKMLEERAIQQVLLFGIPPQDLGIRFALPPYHNIPHRGVHYLWADALPAIFAERQAGGKAMSAKLWKAIQQFDL